MPGFMKKTAVYLGLMEGDDPYAYEEYSEEAEEERPLRLDDDEDEQDRYSASRTESAAEQEARPLFLSEPRRSRDAERPAERSEVARRDGADSAFHGGQSGSYQTARPAPISLLPERTDRYERPASVATAMGSVGHGFGGGDGGSGAGSSSDAYRITTLHPRTYNEARTIGEHFRDGTPVIMNLTEMGDSDAKRLVDFAAGLVFGLRGSIERVTQKVFLLSPANVDVTAEDKARIAEGGFFNQS